jgi:predicted DNA-binding protein
MDERDYKAMNDELKSADETLSKHTGEEGIYLTRGMVRGSDALEAMEEYASQFKKQLKEKEEQLAKSNEMADRLADQIGLFLNFGGKEYLEEALEQYQNSKK